MEQSTIVSGPVFLISQSRKNNRYPTKKIINYKSLFNKVPILSSISKSCIIFSNDGSTNSSSIDV